VSRSCCRGARSRAHASVSLRFRREVSGRSATDQFVESEQKGRECRSRSPREGSPSSRRSPAWSGGALSSLVALVRPTLARASGNRAESLLLLDLGEARLSRPLHVLRLDMPSVRFFPLRRLCWLAPLHRAGGARGPRDLPGQLLHGEQGQRGPPPGQDQLRAHPPRRGAAHPPRGRRGVPPRVPRVPDPLQVQPHQDAQDGLPGHHEHAGPRQALPRQVPHHVDVRGVRGPAGAPADGGVLGQRQLHRGAVVLRRGQARLGDAHHGLPPRAQPRHP